LPPEAKRLWLDLAPQMVRAGVLSCVDGPAFAMLCVHYALALRAASVLKMRAPKRKPAGDPAADEPVLPDLPPAMRRAFGLLSVDERGLFRKHPLNQVFRENSAQFLRYAAEFGMTASSRGRVNQDRSKPGKMKLVDFIASKH
jgi:phage terminase small subunit